MHISENSDYLNALYRDLNEPDHFSTQMSPNTLVEAYLLAMELTSSTAKSYKKLYQLHRFTLTCKRMFLSEQPAKVYALLYRHKIKRVKT